MAQEDLIDLIQMIVARRIDIGSGSLVDNSDSHSRSDILAGLKYVAGVEVENGKGKGKDIGENEQNMKNRARVHQFWEFIER